MNTFGNFVKDRRIQLGKTLRQFCAENDLDAGNFSRIERDRIKPPQSRTVLERWAAALHLKQNSDDWFQYFDLAAAAHGAIPADLMKDEEVLGKLPLLFRTLRGTPVPKEQLKELVAFIRNV